MSKVQVVICDLTHDGQESGSTLRYYVGSKGYDIDVCSAHQVELEALIESLDAYLKVSTDPTGEKQKRTRPERTKTERTENAAIRTWARDQGIDIGERGRINDDLRQRFRESQRGLRAVPHPDSAVTQ